MDGHNWKDQTHTLDWSKFREFFEGNWVTIDNKAIIFEIQRLLDINPSTDTE